MDRHRPRPFVVPSDSHDNDNENVDREPFRKKRKYVADMFSSELDACYLSDIEDDNDSEDVDVVATTLLNNVLPTSFSDDGDVDETSTFLTCTEELREFGARYTRGVAMWSFTKVAAALKSDVTLVVEDKEILAHRFILATVSDTFRVMFNTSGMLESKIDYKIAIEDATYESVRILVDCCYSPYPAKVFDRFLGTHQIYDLLLLSDRYQIGPLTHLLSYKIYQNVMDDGRGIDIDIDSVIALIRILEHSGITLLKGALVESLLLTHPRMLTPEHIALIGMGLLYTVYAPAV